MLTTLGAIVVGTGLWLWILRRYDRIEPEALRYLLVVAVLGGLGSVSVAVLFNEAVTSLLDIRVNLFDNALRVGVVRLLIFSLFVGLNEEICKAVATVYTTRRFGDLNEPIDAMIYAMTVALGFASIENLIYATRFGNEVLLVRFLWPVPAHMAYAAVWGYGLARARFVYPERSRISVMWPSVLLAAVVHAAANFLLFLQATITAMISLAAVGALAYLAHLRLRKLVAESPFLEPGECPNCRNLNSPDATECVYCGTVLLDTTMFVNCPCGQARISVTDGNCHVCGRSFEEASVAATQSGNLGLEKSV